MKIEEAILYVLAERNGGLHGMPADMPSLLGSYFKAYIVNGALGDYVAVKNGQWVLLRSEIDWCDED